MAYPPSVPPQNRTDATAQAGTHAADHNELAAAIAALLAELGSNPSGTSVDVTARLEALTAEVAAASGGITQAQADARYDALGAGTTAANDAVAAHEAKADPHPVYLTAAEGDARYAAAGAGGGSGTVKSVNTKSPDGAGNVTLAATDVGAIPAGDITIIDVVTQAEYDALATKVPTTLYVIQG